MIQKTVARAFPAKHFFVEMLTRDIELQDAILDLLDNCVDGAMRQNKGRKFNSKKPYAGYQAWIDFDGEKIEWLGFDIFVFGGGSLILNGLFFKPAYFYKWIDEVNANGLFTKKDNTQEYIDNYTECAKDNIVESYDLTDISFDVIRVGKTRQRQPYYT